MAKLIDLVVRSIGIVDKPANGTQFIARSEKPDTEGYYDFKVSGVMKIDKKKGGAYGIIYESDKIDLQGDWADLETIERAAHEFMRQHRQHEIDINHDGRLGKAVAVENSIVFPGHPYYPPIDNPAWGQLMEFGEEALMRTQDGELTGFSLEGRAKLDFNAEPPASKSVSVKPLVKF